MKSCCCFTLFAFVIASVSAGEKTSASTSQEYINRQLRNIKVDIAKSYSPDPPPDRIYDVRWSIWEKDLSSDYLLNETFVLADERVLRIEVDVSKVSLHQVALIKDQKSAKFLRTIFWRESLYLLICQVDGSCNLYVGPDANDLRHHQIFKRGGPLVDAEFFTQTNQLYLVVAENSGQFSVSSTIYCWTGTYMDAIAEVETTGAVSLTTFSHKHSTIIIVAQNLEGRSNIGSNVFKFKNGSVQKIQFLDTDGPTLIQHYEYEEKTFLLVINESNESEVFWWDGKEFLNWIKVPEISSSPTKVNIVYVNGHTLLLSAEENTLSLYRIMNLRYKKLNLLELEDRYRITDFNTRVKGSSIILILVKKLEGKLSHVEPMELTIGKFVPEVPPEKTDLTWESLKKLDNMLKDRMPGIVKAFELWPNLLPSSEDIVISSPLKFDNLFLDSGSVFDLVVSSPVEILTPTELTSGLEQINLSTDSLIDKSSDLLFPNEIAEITGPLVVEGDAFFDELHVDSLNVSFLNTEKVEFHGVLSYTKDQKFHEPLRGNSITIQNLEVDSLCGIPFENWKTVDDVDKTALDFLGDNVKILNNTILVQSDLSLDNLGVSRLNNLDLNTFIDDLFILGSNQQIEGTIFFKKGLNVYDLTINSTNGVNADQLLTNGTDQQLGDILIKTLYVDDLQVQRINNVSVNDAARKSEKNILSGQVTFRDLRITEELVVEGVSVHLDLRPLQLYGTVEINGNLVIKNLELISGSSIYLNGSKLDLDSLFDNCWTKSTNQTILNDVTLTRGITIDDFHAKYLNGYAEEDFLYTTVEEIPKKFGAFHFKRFEIDGYLLAEEAAKSFSQSVSVSDHTLIVNQRIQILSFRVVNLSAETYNKIPVEEIAKGKIGVKIPGKTKYENLRIRDDIEVNELTVKFLNNRDLTKFFEEALVVDEDLNIDYLELENLQTDNFEVEELSGLKMADFYRMLQYKDITAVKNITVDGDLLINGDLQVEFINGLTSSNFIEKLSNEDINLTGNRKVDKFTVYGNLSAVLLRGIRIEDLIANTLSKTKPQRITGQYSFYKVQTDSLRANRINRFDVSNLKLVTDPLFIEGDVIFSDLLVEGDITTGSVNGQDIAEIYDNAINVPVNRISNLTISGGISWDISSSDSNSLSYILGNAVTKNTDQIIVGAVAFAGSVNAYRLTCETNIGGVDIPSIIFDAVVPIGQPIEISGQKYLAKGLIVGELSVLGDIEIRNISGWDIVELNFTVVRKFDTRTVSARTIFSDNVTIERLEVSGRVHGLGTQGIATYNGTLPSNTVFENLHVQNELNADKLDGINFKEFMKNRVTISGNHDIYNDVVFREPVVVTQDAILSSINGIGISDVVLSGVEAPQIISSEKTFSTNFTVFGDVIVDVINDTHVTEEFQNGIFNDKDIYIDGNLIFAADFETQSNVSLTGTVNEIDLDKFTEDLITEDITRLRNLEKNQFATDKMIDRSLNYSKKLPDIFFYFDTQSEVVIRVPNIRKVQTLTVESMTKLNLYGVEEGRYCGLPDFCPCRTQYVAELLENECNVWKLNGSKITYNIHDSENRYGVNIFSNSSSSGPLCTLQNYGTEITNISWIVPRKLPTDEILGQITNNTLGISGYLSDVKTFTIGEKLYVVLAIYYDAVLKSHQVDSLVYEIDLIDGDIDLSQKIGTSGAVALDVFATQHGMHLLIACKHDPAESQLHRFNMMNSKFELLRSFRTGGSSNVKSMFQDEQSFVLLDDPLPSVHIFKYNKAFDNYQLYQSLYHSSAVKDIEVFYSGAFGVSDAFVIVTTDEGQFFVYEYMFFGGFQVRSQQWLDGVQTMVPFHFSQRRYIFAGTVTNSTVYRIVQQGPNYS